MRSSQVVTKDLMANNMYKDEEGNIFYAYTDKNFSITCWRLTFWEKIKLLFSGKIWLLVMGPQVPMKITTKEEDIFE